MTATPHSVLIAEDEGLVSLMLEDMVRDLGARSVDVFAGVAEAIEAAASTHYDFAILDVILRDGTSSGVADLLDERGVPFLFASAVGADALDERHRSRRLISKPFEEEELKAHILGLLG
jgi:CheY-like chemotaxis protein